MNNQKSFFEKLSAEATSSSLSNNETASLVHYPKLGKLVASLLETHGSVDAIVKDPQIWRKFKKEFDGGASAKVELMAELELKDPFVAEALSLQRKTLATITSQKLIFNQKINSKIYFTEIAVLKNSSTQPAKQKNIYLACKKYLLESGRDFYYLKPEFKVKTAVLRDLLTWSYCRYHKLPTYTTFRVDWKNQDVYLTLLTDESQVALGMNNIMKDNLLRLLDGKLIYLDFDKTIAALARLAKQAAEKDMKLDFDVVFFLLPLNNQLVNYNELCFLGDLEGVEITKLTKKQKRSQAINNFQMLMEGLRIFVNLYTCEEDSMPLPLVTFQNEKGEKMKCGEVLTEIRRGQRYSLARRIIEFV